MTTLKLCRYYKPKGWPCRPIAFRRATEGSALVHAAQPADARNAALQAQNEAATKYNDDNAVLGSDITSYSQTNDNYNRVKHNMTQQDSDACFNDLSQAYMALDTENTHITAAYEFLLSGNNYFDQAEVETNLMIKVSKYGMATGQYNSAKSACTDAEGAHTAFTPKIDAANLILANYG
jgi:hypothetical protein